MQSLGYTGAFDHTHHETLIIEINSNFQEAGTNLGMIEREKMNETDLNLKASDLKLGLNERCVGRFAEFV